jgi:hypothetical protein
VFVLYQIGKRLNFLRIKTELLVNIVSILFMGKFRSNRRVKRFVGFPGGVVVFFGFRLLDWIVDKQCA